MVLVCYRLNCLWFGVWCFVLSARAGNATLSAMYLCSRLVNGVVVNFAVGPLVEAMVCNPVADAAYSFGFIDRFGK